MERRTGKRPPEMEPPEVEEAGLYLLDLHREIRRTASSSWDGALGLADILNYQQVYSIPISAWEVDAVLMLDSLFKEAMK